VGILSESERQKRRLPEASLAGEIRIDEIPGASELVRFRPYSAFPPVAADLSFLQRRELPWSELEWFVRGQGLAHLETLRLLDRYEGEGVPGERVKTTLRLTFRAVDRTLEQEEVNREVERLAIALRDKLGVEI
jgi:phenylalanyl-tRNA synthetase beta chain